jgi:hypothetical protein
VTPPVVTTPVVTTPVVTTPVVTTPTCTAPTISSATNGTFSVTINSVSYAGSIVDGILYANDAGLNATGSGSGVVSGTVSGSSGGNDGYVLSSGLRLVTGTATGTAIIGGVTYNLTVSSTSNLAVTCQ